MTLLSSNRTLLDAFRAGDPQVLRQVIRHYGPPLAASVRRGVHFMRGGQSFHFRGPSAELEVERVVQDTLSRALSPAARAAYDGITPFGAYLARIARNLLINEAGARRRAGEPTPSGELPELTSLEPSPEEQVQTGQMQALVQEFVAGRPEADRALFRARFRDGLSQEAWAERLGASRITVRRAEARFKAAFLEFLARRGVAPATRKEVLHDA